MALYTTWRQKNTSINQWCTTVEAIVIDLRTHAPNWVPLAGNDSVRRLTAFISPKEREVLEKELVNNHATTWERNDKSLDTYFRLSKFDDVLVMIRDIDVSKFPGAFDPFKHTPDALKTTLFTYVEMETKTDKARVAEAKAAAAEENLSKANREIRSLKDKLANPKRRSEDPPPKSPKKQRRERNPKPPASVASIDLTNETEATKALMAPSTKTGKLPCIK